MAMMEAEKPEDERDESRVADLVKYATTVPADAAPVCGAPLIGASRDDGGRFGRRALEDMKPQDDDLGLRTVIPQVADQFLAAHQRKRADEDKAKRQQGRGLADSDRHT
jgi:hypothetical protein